MNKCVYEFEGVIWQMMTDAAGITLAVEVRNEEEHQVRFSVINLQNDEVLWKNLLFDEQWWVGLAAIDDQHLLLHTYLDTENPQQKGYQVVDIHSRHTIWASETFQVLEKQGPTLWGFYLEQDEKIPGQINVLTQQEKRLTTWPVQTTTEEKNKNQYSPFHYPDSSPYFDTVKQFVVQYTQTTPVRGCEYLEFGDHILIGYYIEEGQALANYLLVLDTTGKIFLHEKLDQNLQKIGLGTFFIAKDKLILVKEKNQLVSYAL